MDQIGAGVAADAMNKLLVAPLIQQIDDVIHLDQNRGLLQAKLNLMKLILQDIWNGFQNQQRMPPMSIRDCLERTRDAIGETKSLIDRSQLQQRCLDRVFCKPRISRQIREWNARFDELRQELQFLFSTFASAQRIIASFSAQVPAKELLQPLPESGIVGVDIKSAEKQLQTLINAEAPQFRIIGVYGMAGVGKTTLLRSVYNSYKVSDVFEVVIWVTVSQCYKIRELQGRIAEVLKLDHSRISDLDTDTLKMMLSASLVKRKFLLILDDMWSALDLQQELGVQFGDDKASKVVFSTRSRDVALTEANVSMKVEPLSRDEGWELFQRVAFKERHVPEELKECAREIADECEGLPLAITVVGAAMRGKGAVADEWKSCLYLMKNADPSFPDTHPHVDQQLYRRLRWSYDDLSTTPNLQNCFLYCALYPEDARIRVERLVVMWIADGFVKSKEATYSTDMQLGYRYVKILIDRGLFQNYNFEKQSKPDILVNKPVSVWKERYITVHDVVRDMAIYIGEREENYVCRAGQQLQDFPDSRSRADCKRISLCGNQIKCLRKDFLSQDVRPRLVSLLLSENPLGYKLVQEDFLMNLTSLRILDLSSTSIESVPTSLTQLALLEFLDLSRTKIKELPKDIGKLTQLQYLNVSYCNQLKSVPSSIGKLTQLQYLNLYWCNELVSVPSSIGKLTQLHCMDLWCPNLVVPPEICQVTSLRKLSLLIPFRIGPLRMGTWSEMTHLRLGLNKNMNIDLLLEMQNMKKLQSFELFDYEGVNLPNWICEFQQLERLHLLQCTRVEELPSLERLPNLKYLKLEGCSEVKDLGIGSSGNPGGFPMLEMLVLKEMKKLQSMAGSSPEGGVLKEGALPKLRVLKIIKCSQVRKLARGMEKLPNLIALFGCERWWENIIWEDNNMKICLHKLFKTKTKYYSYTRLFKAGEKTDFISDLAADWWIENDVNLEIWYLDLS